jgi:outer membrane protein OmpA-like peptidoglycan-associated protein
LSIASTAVVGCHKGGPRLGRADQPTGERAPALQSSAASDASPDSAPSVVPAAGGDTSHPEFDSLKAMARRSGVPDSLIPGALPSRGGRESASPTPARAAELASTSETPPSAGIPLVTGLRIVSTLVFPDGDRDNVVTTTVSEGGVTYAWHLHQQEGAKAQEFDLRRFVRSADLNGAPRLNQVVGTEGPEETPGYTFISLSRATYQKLRASGEVPFTITAMEGGPFGGALSGLGSSRVTYKGSFTVASPTPVDLPVLVDGRRTTLPALHLTGRFAFQDAREDGDYWVLADSTHPLILKSMIEKNAMQVIRIDRPTTAASTVERELASDCRAELPGIYFAFASAALDPASMPALEGVAAMLKRHADWTLAVEGHTDSVGGAASNQKLSQQRAEAVRTALTSRLGVAPARLSAAGFGATRPKEPNGTVEGRARNRRVELVRPCPGKT